MKRLSFALLTVALMSAAAAQPLSGPPGVGLPAGTGAGVHDPRSAFAPLPARTDVVSWGVLTDISVKVERNRAVPVYKPAQLALNQRTARIQGFMMPLQTGEKQTHFLLSSVPLSCGFCSPGGPESMVEVRSRKPVTYTTDPVVVEGKFAVLENDPYGLYYRVTDAIDVK